MYFQDVLAQLILAFLTVLLFLLPDRIQIWEKFITSGRMLLLITVIGIVANGYYLYSPREEDYAGDFSEIKDFDPEIRIDPEKYPDEWSTAAVNNFWYSDASLIHDASGDKDGREFIRMSGLREMRGIPALRT